MNELNWEDFNNFVKRKNLLVTLEREVNGYGIFVASDGPTVYKCRVSTQRSVYNDAKLLASDSPVSQKVSGVVEPDGLHARFIGAFNFEAPVGETIKDYTLNEDRIFDGVMYEAKGNWSDQITFQVVHPIYGVVDMFASDFFVSSEPVTMRVYRATLQAGLILRVIYKNNGTEAAKFKANFFLHEKK